MFKYRQEQRQKVTQRILSQEFRANTLTPALKIGSPLSSDEMVEGNLRLPAELAVGQVRLQRV